MADTIITNTPGTGDSGSGALGWVVALIVILAVVVGGFLWVRRGAPTPAPASTNINVQLPEVPTGNTGGNAGGGTTE